MSVVDVIMVGVLQSHESLKKRIAHVGYFPELCWQVLEIALAGEEAEAYVVQREAHFSLGGAGSHLTVLVLTPSRLIFCHVDDHAEGVDERPMTAATTDAVALKAVNAVGITHLVEHSQDAPGGMDRSVTLAVSWGAANRIELHPASCGDEDCVADHGYTGALTSDDICIRISEVGDGPEVIEETLNFAQALSQATAR